MGTGQKQTLQAENAAEAIWPIPTVYLLHGKGGSPNGTVKKLESVLEQHWSGLEFVRPALPHSDPTVPAEASVEYLVQMRIPRGALLVGISLGGLVAAKLQEIGREDLQVLAISSPTWADGVHLERRAGRRLAFFSSQDEVIATRVADWARFAAWSYDFDWLNHDTDQHLRYIVRLFDWFLEGTLARWIDDIRGESTTREERDDIVWGSMAHAPRDRSPWRESPWSGGWPQTFADMGLAMQSCSDWEDAWSGWSHSFMFRKDARCLNEEPPVWFPPERRAMLAGAAEFLAKLYGLPKPAWVDKQEYFLPNLDYYGCVISIGEGQYAMLIPETVAEDYRLRARTPKEMLRRNVIFPARNLTVL